MHTCTHLQIHQALEHDVITGLVHGLEEDLALEHELEGLVLTNFEGHYVTHKGLVLQAKEEEGAVRVQGRGVIPGGGGIV
jgi:hypothetical protein